MTEKDLENLLVRELRRGHTDPNVLGRMAITGSTSNASTLYDLVGGREFDLFQEDSDWNPDKRWMVDIGGGIIPDIVPRSKASGQNRIYIEVKLHEDIRDVPALSQVVRQFLHLLCSTECAPPAAPRDIRRAVLLAAPSSWFEHEKRRGKWQYFRDSCTPLATLPKIDITLGELELDWLLGMGVLLTD